jgi:Ca2+-binding EF-hand superfamily protein
MQGQDAADFTTSDQRDDLEIFRLVFELFDTQKTGYISKQLLLQICMGYLNNDANYFHQIKTPEEMLGFLELTLNG